MRTPSAATTTSGRQPNASAKPGQRGARERGACGTPVCLIENVSAMRAGGVVRISTCDDAGVIGP